LLSDCCQQFITIQLYRWKDIATAADLRIR
jgi:hypothetical protein